MKTIEMNQTQNQTHRRKKRPGFGLVVMMTVLAMLVLPLGTMADTFTEGGLRYNTFSATMVEVVKPESGKYSGDITIPATVTHNETTYRVTAIGDYAFQNAKDLTSVTLPLTSIERIGERAFNDCTGLTEFTLPESITDIGEGAFYYCDNLKHLYVHSPDPARYNPGQLAFSNIHYGSHVCTLHVPTGCTAAYTADSSPFKGFTQVEEFDPPVTYPIYIANEKVTYENASDILGDGAASYDAEKNTLTIKGNITNSDENSACIRVYYMNNLTINVAEPVALTSAGTVIYTYFTENITITGSSLLKLASPKDKAAIDCRHADLAIVNAHLEIEGGIGCVGKNILAINNSSVTVETTYSGGAISDWDDLKLTDCYLKTPQGGKYDIEDKRLEDSGGNPAQSVEIKSGVAPTLYDLHVIGKRVTSENASDILGDGAASYDAEKNTLTIKDDITSQDKNTPCISNNMIDLTIEVTSPVTLTAAATAIRFYKNTKITGSSLLKLISPKDMFAIKGTKADMEIVDANLEIEGCVGDNFLIKNFLTIINSSVTIESTYSDGAIYGWNDLKLSDCSLKTPQGGTYNDISRRLEDTKIQAAKSVEIRPTHAPNGLAFSKDEATAKIGEDYTLPTLTNPNSLTVTWESSVEKVAAVNASTGAVTLVAPGQTIIIATFAGNEYYQAGSVSYVLTVEAVKGDVNHDGHVDQSDIKAVVDYIMTGKTDGIYLDNADLNEDKKVNTTDLVLLINKVK